jgi:hypothetical protein
MIPLWVTQVRDIFLFSCYTGLAYSDVQKLRRSEISTGIDGGKWIFTRRRKIDTASRIPILPMAETILLRYTDPPAPFYRFPINRTNPHIPCIGTAQPPFPDFIQEIDYQTIIKTARSWWFFIKLLP